MKKTVSFLVALSSVAVSIPLGFAACNATAAIASCSDKTGVDRVLCVHEKTKAETLGTAPDMRNTRAKEAMTQCKSLEGTEKRKCMTSTVKGTRDAHSRMGKTMMMKRSKTAAGTQNGPCAGERNTQLASCLQEHSRNNQRRTK